MEIMGMNQGREKEEDVLNIIKKYFKNSSIYEHQNSKSWGEPSFDQDYIYDGVVYKCPDIFSIGSSGEIILRVEVKGFWCLETFNDVKVVKIEKRLFDSYLKLQKKEEIPCSVVFSIGEYGCGRHEYYWESLNNLTSLPNKISLECIYWRISDLNYGINGFLKYLESMENSDW